MKKSWLTLGILALCITGCATTGQKWGAKESEKEEGDEIKVPFAQVPPAVQAQFAKQAPGVAIAEVDKESDNGKTIYEADAVIAGQNYEIKVAEDGSLIGKKVDNEAAEKKDSDKEEKEEAGEHKNEKKDKD